MRIYGANIADMLPVLRKLQVVCPKARGQFTATGWEVVYCFCTGCVRYG